MALGHLTGELLSEQALIPILAQAGQHYPGPALPLGELGGGLGRQAKGGAEKGPKKKKKDRKKGAKVS